VTALQPRRKPASSANADAARERAVQAAAAANRTAAEKAAVAVAADQTAAGAGARGVCVCAPRGNEIGVGRPVAGRRGPLMLAPKRRNRRRRPCRI